MSQTSSNDAVLEVTDESSSSSDEGAEQTPRTSTTTKGSKRKLFGATTPVAKRARAVPTASTKKSLLWTWFKPSDDDKDYITCLICKQDYKTNNSSTGPMSQHLKAKHKKHHREYLLASGKALQEDVWLFNHNFVKICLWCMLKFYIFKYTYVYRTLTKSYIAVI
jgi:hypothetical protein